ncbi:hypothetical protein [Priestia megaterium]|uniref:hypothetical protein n=1 Tax=Priestia megaterium TaxID=1404 RepID=UPI003000B11C
MTGRDMFGNKISEEQRKASLLQALGIAGAGALSTKVAGKTAKAGANAVANGAKKLSDMRNVLSKQATQRIMPPLQSAQKAYRSSSNYIKKKISQAGDIKLAPKKVRVVEEPLTGTRMPVVDEWITGKDVGRMFSVRSGETGETDRRVESESGARYGDQKISDKLYSRLRKETPTDELRDMVNEGVDLPMPDPALPGLEITKRLEADHIVPMKNIARMEGFDKLTYEQQVALLNYRDNFIGLSKIANTSKGSKTYEEWVIYKKRNIEVDPTFRKKMMGIEKELQVKIQGLIDGFLKE